MVTGLDLRQHQWNCWTWPQLKLWTITYYYWTIMMMICGLRSFSAGWWCL